MKASENFFQQLEKSRFFRKSNLVKAASRFRLRKKMCVKTAFMTSDGLYEFLRMHFGMENSDATVVRGMREVLSGMSVVESYIYDLIVFFSHWRTHIETLKKYLRRLSEVDSLPGSQSAFLGLCQSNFWDMMSGTTGLRRMIIFWTKLQVGSGQSRRRKFDRSAACTVTTETISLPLL